MNVTEVSFVLLSTVSQLLCPKISNLNLMHSTSLNKRKLNTTSNLDKLKRGNALELYYREKLNTAIPHKKNQLLVAVGFVVVRTKNEAKPNGGTARTVHEF